ncbi:hypothetical protein [Companilactobacillus nodensis]|uniref:hypothetical protein n=1 Tax=Companilactobacillus nodensis TaxID=460870 RepID=UPI000704E518|nr:hypothetical protein [Companilactobacillus nodensis]
MNLSKEVIASEFPNLNLNSKDGKKVVLTFKNGKDVVIAKENDDGGYDSELYEFSNVDDKVVWPDTPELPNNLAKLDLDSWNGVVDSNARDDLNNNRKQIQTTVNSMVGYVIDQRDFFTKFKTSLSDFKSFILKLINVSVSEFMHENVETKYYSKTEVDNLLKTQNKKISNIQGRLPNNTTIGTFHNPSRSDQMPSNIDVNDQVTDEAQSVIDDWDK